MRDAAGARQFVAQIASAPSQPVPAFLLAADRIGTTAVPNPDWMRAQLTAELVAHGMPSAAGVLVGVLTRGQVREESLAVHFLVQRAALGRALMAVGRYREAFLVYRSLVRENTSHIGFRGALGAVAARVGDQETAEAAHRWTDSGNDKRPGTTGALPFQPSARLLPTSTSRPCRRPEDHQPKPAGLPSSRPPRTRW